MEIKQEQTDESEGAFLIQDDTVKIIKLYKPDYKKPKKSTAQQA